MRTSVYERLAAKAAAHKGNLIEEGASFARIREADDLYRMAETALNGLRIRASFFSQGEITDYTERKNREMVRDFGHLDANDDGPVIA